jgi:hypothetical protein
MRRSSKRRRYRPAAEPLSRPQQIKEALMLLDAPEQIDEWRPLVEHALDVMDLRSRLVPSLRGPASKQGKSEVRRYRNALVRSPTDVSALQPGLGSHCWRRIRRRP